VTSPGRCAMTDRDFCFLSSEIVDGWFQPVPAFRGRDQVALMVSCYEAIMANNNIAPITTPMINGTKMFLFLYFSSLPMNCGQKK